MFHIGLGHLVIAGRMTASDFLLRGEANWDSFHLIEQPRIDKTFHDDLGAARAFRVTVADPKHPLVAGVEPFETTDETYLLETYGELHVMLETEFGVKVKNETSARDYFRSISTLAELVETRLAAQAGA